MAMAEVEVRED